LIVTARAAAVKGDARRVKSLQARPGQKKKAVQKVQAPAQPFIAFNPA
jgi:hypothetical protein